MIITAVNTREGVPCYHEFMLIILLPIALVCLAATIQTWRMFRKTGYQQYRAQAIGFAVGALLCAGFVVYLLLFFQID